MITVSESAKTKLESLMAESNIKLELVDAVKVSLFNSKY